MTAAELVDSLGGGRVLVFGSPPPGGRDLDLLVRGGDREAIAAALLEAGFLRARAAFARFGGCSAEGVDLVLAEEWGLEPDALEALFADALPLPGFERLVRPAPRDALLVAARRLGRGGLGPKLRSRVEAALAEDPGALEAARAAAPGWRAERAFARLEALRRGEGRRSWRSLFRRPRRPVVVALSGLDGAGKSTQAEALVAALDRLGIDAVAVWSPLGGHPLQRLVGYPAKWLLRRLRGGSGSIAETTVMAAPGRGPSPARSAWAGFGGILNALTQRLAALRHPGKVVVCDRQALDTVVRMRFLYGAAPAAGLIRALAPTPRFAFYLDIRAETSLARKDDVWSLDELREHASLYHEELERHGVRRLDGERPQEELCAEIARSVWLGLSPAGGSPA